MKDDSARAAEGSPEWKRIARHDTIEEGWQANRASSHTHRVIAVAAPIRDHGPS